MLQADIYSFHRVEYIVIDTAEITMSKDGLCTLASYRHGVGADRILLVDKSMGQVIAAADGCGNYHLMSAEDYQVANTALGKIKPHTEMHYRELRITEFFLQQLAADHPFTQLAC